ncbi:MAG TPA: hypothetical protein VNA26_07440 [Chitinophagaceae bacterium]|nr:hypothetical protein [Chitinophagaceae bacterium]
MNSQVALSVGTDFSLLHDFTKNQQFTSFGQTVQFNFHFSKKQSLYTWIGYYTNGKYQNDLTALPRFLSTTPPSVPYTSFSKIGYRQISVGWKHYFKGGFDIQGSYAIYGLAGFGLVFGHVENTFNKTIDTSKYRVPQLPGSGKFRRLTFDLGLGIDVPIGTAFYFYGEVRTWLPASNYPSPYLYNSDAPRVLLLNGGLRLLFDY